MAARPIVAGVAALLSANCAAILLARNISDATVAIKPFLSPFATMTRACLQDGGIFQNRLGLFVPVVVAGVARVGDKGWGLRVGRGGGGGGGRRR